MLIYRKWLVRKLLVDVVVVFVQVGGYGLVVVVGDFGGWCVGCFCWVEVVFVYCLVVVFVVIVVLLVGFLVVCWVGYYVVVGGWYVDWIIGFCCLWWWVDYFVFMGVGMLQVVSVGGKEVQYVVQLDLFCIGWQVVDVYFVGWYDQYIVWVVGLVLVVVVEEIFVVVIGYLQVFVW